MRGIIGNFGYFNKKIDGQTIKTQNLKNLLDYKQVECETVDISAGINFNNILNIITLFYKCKLVYILPGKGGVSKFLPFFIVFSFLFNCKIEYVVIGGWLPDLLKNNRFLLFISKYISAIYVETLFMKSKLESLGLSNAIYLPNFRKVQKNNKFINDSCQQGLKIVYFSRVMKEKGVEIAINAVKSALEKDYSSISEFSIYGQFDNNYTISNLKKNDAECYYKGIIEQEDIYSVLSKFDILIFPTYYSGEGFPGVFLDAFSSSLIVLCSDWKYNAEIINDGFNGFIIKDGDYSSVICKLNSDVKLTNSIKYNSFISANKYSYDVASIILKLEC